MNSERRRIEWLNHFLEFIVVIIGILIAFQLNKCSSDRNLQKTADIHVSQIIEETEMNKKSFEYAIDYLELNNIKLDSIIGLVNNNEKHFVINQLSLELLELGGVYIRKNAYKTLTETGDIKFLSSFELKEDIVNLYEFYSWVETFNTTSNTLYMDDYYPYLRDNFDLVNGSIQDQDIYFSKKYKNILGAYYRTNINRLTKYKESLEQIEKFLEKNE